MNIGFFLSNLCPLVLFKQQSFCLEAKSTPSRFRRLVGKKVNKLFQVCISPWQQSTVYTETKKAWIRNLPSGVQNGAVDIYIASDASKHTAARLFLFLGR